MRRKFVRSFAFAVCLLGLAAGCPSEDADEMGGADGGPTDQSDAGPEGGSGSAGSSAGSGADAASGEPAGSGGSTAGTGSSSAGHGESDAGGSGSGVPELGEGIGIAWTVDGTPYSAAGAVDLQVVGIQSGSGKATESTITGGSLVDTSNVRLTLTVPSPEADPVTLPAGTYSCAAASSAAGETFVQIRETVFISSADAPECYITIDEASGDGGRIKGSFKATVASPAFADRAPVVEGNFDLTDSL